MNLETDRPGCTATKEKYRVELRPALRLGGSSLHEGLVSYRKTSTHSPTGRGKGRFATWRIELNLSLVLNPKRYDSGARVLEAPGRPMLVIGRSFKKKKETKKKKCYRTVVYKGKFMKSKLSKSDKT